MQEQFERFGITSHSRISAVSSSLESPTGEQVELCVTKSHLKAIRQGIESEAPVFVVMEDNVELVGSIDFELIASFAPTREQWGLLQLTSLWPQYLNRLLRRRRARRLNPTFFEPGHYVGAKLYLVNHDYARQIVDRVTERLEAGEHCVADYIIWQQAPTYICQYPLVQLKPFSSTIEDYHNWYTHNYISKVQRIHATVQPPPFLTIGSRLIPFQPEFVSLQQRSREVHLITQYYQASSEARQRELDYCLETNLANPMFTRIHLLDDKGACLTASQTLQTPCNFNHNRISSQVLNRRMTYYDAVEYALDNIPLDAVTVIANSDIVIPPESVQKILAWLKPEQVYALTRWEAGRVDSPVSDAKIHWVEWSQDVWVYVNGKLQLNEEMRVELGSCGCDNLIAKTFGDQLELDNPGLAIKTYHYHSSGERNYQITHPPREQCRHIFPRRHACTLQSTLELDI